MQFRYINNTSTRCIQMPLLVQNAKRKFDMNLVNVMFHDMIYYLESHETSLSGSLPLLPWDLHPGPGIGVTPPGSNGMFDDAICCYLNTVRQPFIAVFCCSLSFSFCIIGCCFCFLLQQSKMIF